MAEPRFEYRAQSRSGFNFRPQSLYPLFGHRKDGWERIVRRSDCLNGGSNFGLVSQNLAGGAGNSSFDFRRWHPSAALDRVRFFVEKGGRDIVAISPLAFHGMTRRQAQAVFIKEFIADSFANHDAGRIGEQTAVL